MPPPPEIALACAKALQEDGRPTFALLDAARDPGVLAFIAEYGLQSRCLYAGHDQELLDYAPYIVSLSPDQITALVARAWGDSWGVFLKSDADIPTLRRHFRKFLMVELETGEEVYFRFYDPRVLRVFLPTCDENQWREFFGPISTFAMESPDIAVMLTAEANLWRATSRLRLVVTAAERVEPGFRDDDVRDRPEAE
jgi:hypothetical protein